MKTQPNVILTVDDDPFNLDIVDEHLSGKGYELLQAVNGEEALNILHNGRHKVDVVLLDRMMPGIDGIEVLQRIKQDPNLRGIPVIMLTAAHSPEQIAEGISNGCFYYLTKPFSKTVLCAVVESALRESSIKKVLLPGMQVLQEAIAEERHKTHQATLMATYHYLNNSLNQFQLVLMELETKGTIDPAIHQALKESIHKTAADMMDFGRLENPTRENVLKFIKEHL